MNPWGMRAVGKALWGGVKASQGEWGREGPQQVMAEAALEVWRELDRN